MSSDWQERYVKCGLPKNAVNLHIHVQTHMKKILLHSVSTEMTHTAE